MHVGVLTAPFGNEPLENVAKFAGDAGFASLEIIAGPGSKHINPATFDDSRKAEVEKLMEENNLSISSLCHYGNVNEAGKSEEIIAHFKKTIDAAVALGVDVVCGLAGHPVPGKTKAETIREVVPIVYKPVCEYAADKGVKIALENWYETCIQHLGHFDMLFETIPDANFGLNFDPSHLIWQGIDYLEAVEAYADRIFHTHAKDTEMKQHILRKVGCLESGWWRYVIPGYGEINWGVYVERLRGIGYDGVLSIEHEDGAQGREEGFVRALTHLGQFM